MREIKFKAWDKATNQFVEEHARLYLNGCVSVCGMWATKDVALLQYAGKKDNEGAEIYDGDIVLIDGESGDPCLDVVHWDGESTAFYCLECGEWPTDMKVIGSIYQNPELLESK